MEESGMLPRRMSERLMSLMTLLSHLASRSARFCRKFSRRIPGIPLVLKNRLTRFHKEGFLRLVALQRMTLKR